MGSCCGKASEAGNVQAAFRTDCKNPLLDPSTEMKDAKYVVITLSQMDNIRLGSSNSHVNSFVEMKLLPSNINAQAQQQYSSVKPSTSQPKWEPPEQFNFLISDLATAKMIISARHYAPPKHKDLGDAVLKLSEVEGSTGSILKTMHFRNPDTGNVQHHMVFEFERWVGNWGHDHDLLPTDPPGRWCSQDGKKFGPDADSVAPPVPEGYVITEDWSTTSTFADPDGWQYSTDFNYEFWYPDNSGTSMFVRRRLWHRKMQLGSTISSSHAASSSPSANSTPSSPSSTTTTTTTTTAAAATTSPSTGAVNNNKAVAASSAPGQRQRLFKAE
eukprot:gene32695-42341_t